MNDYYSVLGVDKNADSATIKKKYRELALIYHPDKNNGDPKSEARFKEISEAYDILGTPSKKSEYDLKRSGGFDPFFGGFNTWGNTNKHYGNTNSKKFKKGSNVNAYVTLTLEEMVAGVTKRVKLDHKCKCPNCEGSGSSQPNKVKDCTDCFGSGVKLKSVNTAFGHMYTQETCNSCQGEGIIIEDRCKICGGTGTINESKEFDVKVPPGILPGMTISQSGLGNSVRNPGIPGDLILNFQEYSHDIFRRDGHNIMYDVKITFPEVCLGTYIEFVNLRGTKVRLRIPKGTEPGKMFRIRGEGIPEINLSNSGDLLVVIQMEIPKDLSEEEEEELKKLETLPSFRSKR
jgi:molecular chaperone DnaJ